MQARTLCQRLRTLLHRTQILATVGRSTMNQLFHTILLFVIASLLTACATKPERDDEGWRGAGASVRVMEYVVRPGDSLASIAREMTGNVYNWVAIADFNNITEPSVIQVGDLVWVPSELLLAENQTLATTTVPVNVAFTNPEQVAVTEEPVVMPVAAESETSTTRANTRKTGTEPIFQPSALPGVKQATVTTQPVVINRTFDISRSSNLATQNTVGGFIIIQVTGSTYPKGIYAQPFSHSPLLMQAQPGAKFTLDQQLGDWLRINTEKGPGYIRSRDAKMVGASYTTKVIPDKALG